MSVTLGPLSAIRSPKDIRARGLPTNLSSPATQGVTNGDDIPGAIPKLSETSVPGEFPLCTGACALGDDPPNEDQLAADAVNDRFSEDRQSTIILQKDGQCSEFH